MLCLKCDQIFDYEYFRGVSVTALRFGSTRYMRCPLCGQYSRFNMTGPEPSSFPSEGGLASTPPGGLGYWVRGVASADGTVPKFSDVRLTLLWTLGVVVPALGAVLIVSILLLRPPNSSVAIIGITGIFVALAVVPLLGLRIPRVGVA
jgi:hypothetical protein